MEDICDPTTMPVGVLMGLGAKEGKGGRLEPVCTCPEVTAGRLTVCQGRGRVFQERALATCRPVSQPARQAASRIVCSLGLGLEPGLERLKLPRQIC